MSTTKIVLFFVCAVNTLISSAQYEGHFGNAKRVILDIQTTKTGPYIGIQRGKYTVLEIGGERQWKKFKLVKPITHAAHVGLNYNFKYNVFGMDAGYWIKPHRIGLTYGANLFYRTDFTYNKIGLAPVVGFKFWLLHLQAGYHMMSRPTDFETNTLFVSLRLGWINDRDIEWNRSKKK